MSRWSERRHFRQRRSTGTFGNRELLSWRRVWTGRARIIRRGRGRCPPNPLARPSTWIHYNFAAARRPWWPSGGSPPRSGLTAGQQKQWLSLMFDYSIHPRIKAVSTNYATSLPVTTLVTRFAERQVTK